MNSLEAVLQYISNNHFLVTVNGFVDYLLKINNQWQVYNTIFNTYDIKNLIISHDNMFTIVLK